jgi:hypothetical protein
LLVTMVTELLRKFVVELSSRTKYKSHDLPKSLPIGRIIAAVQRITLKGFKLTAYPIGT